VNALRPGPDPDALHAPALDAYRAAVPKGMRADFAITPLDRLGVPVWTAALWPENGPFCNGVGYALCDEDALTSAYGEMVEVVGVFEAVRRLPCERASYRDLARGVGEGGVLDPRAGCLPAGSPYTPDTVLEWVPMQRHGDGGEVLVPVEFVASRFADLGEDPRPEERLFTPITNGLGAGLSVRAALVHAVLELHQRDGNGVSFRSMDEGVVLDLDEVRTPATRDLLALLEAEGIDVQVKLASTGFGMANVYVVGADRDGSRAGHPLAASACGEAVHPDRERALRKALTEFCSSRARKPFNHGPLEPIARIAPEGYLEQFRRRPLGSEEDRSLEAMLDWLSLSHDELKDLIAPAVFRERRRVPFSSLPHTEDPGDPEALVDFLHGRLEEEGLDLLYVDVSPREPDGTYSGEARAVKAIVPGLEVETMSYGRIGIRNVRRLLDRDPNLPGAGLVGMGEPPADRPGARRVLLTERDEAELGGPAWFDYETAERIVGLLYPLYREPGRHVAALAAERRGIR